jgi:anti-sigma regulatory factor (Ser/Thr protein kinase)
MPATGRHSVELAATPHEVGAARSHVARLLTAWAVPADVIEVAVLLTSELATNAVTHGRGDGGLFTVDVRSYGNCIGVEVSDSSAGTPVVHAQSDLSEHRRGLFLVTELADSWGYYFSSGDRRKYVWFHLHLGDPAS